MNTNTNRDPKAGKYKREFKDAFQVAELVLKPYSGSLVWSGNDYEAFRFLGEGVCLVFYPHKTSAMNYHIRVRDQGSKDKAFAVELMMRLRIGSGHNCTFSSKSTNTFMAESKLADRDGLEFGWARRQVMERPLRKSRTRAPQGNGGRDDQ